MGKYCKLIMISSENNNKFYEMLEENGQITVKYGRVESTSVTIYKPLYQWDSIVWEKEKKGYKNVTDLVSVKEEIKSKVVEEKTEQIKDVYVREFIDLLEKYTKGLVSTTYSVTPKSVTEQQIKEAQILIDELQNYKNFTEAQTNSFLIKLYTTIPRRMKDVRLHLLPKLNLDKTLQQEQDNLDAMSSLIDKKVEVKAKKVKVKKENTVLDKIGVSMELTNSTPEIQYIVDQLNKQSYHKVHKIFKVVKQDEDEKLNTWIKNRKNKETRFLIHGTRMTSVLPIMEQGLKIRPQGSFQFSGKVYGDGNYFSETASKSLNYTGGTQDRVFFVYEVHTGNPFVYKGWWTGNSFQLTEKELNNRGFDSTFVEAGNGLLNSEIIVYNENQCSPKYIIWIK